MAKTSRDKSRKGKLEQFKLKEKKKNIMSETQFKPFNQVPVWEDDAEFKMTGKEFTALKNFFAIFAEPLGSMQDIFTRNLDSGVITVKYEDMEGNEISKETIEKQLKAFEAKMAIENTKIPVSENIETEG